MDSVTSKVQPPGQPSDEHVYAVYGPTAVSVSVHDPSLQSHVAVVPTTLPAFRAIDGTGTAMALPITLMKVKEYPRGAVAKLSPEIISGAGSPPYTMSRNDLILCVSPSIQMPTGYAQGRLRNR